MVAQAGLLEALEVLLQLGLGEEGRAVDAGEHRAIGVPAPVGAGERVQLEGADRLGGGGVGSAAEVGEGPVGVQRDRLQGMLGRGGADEVVDQLDLVVLPLVREALTRLRDGDVLADELLGGFDVLAHAGFDRRQVGLRDGRPGGELEVVVEAVLRSEGRSRS